MRKTSHSTNRGKQYEEFHAEVKFNIAPVIAKTFTDEDGVEMHVLANGNHQSKVSYDQYWNKPKTPILPQHSRHKNFEKRDLKRMHHVAVLFLLWTCLSCSSHWHENYRIVPGNKQLWDLRKAYKERHKSDSSNSKLSNAST